MADTMLAAVFKGEGRLELEQRPVPKIQRDDDVILQVGAAGICGGDLDVLAVPKDEDRAVQALDHHWVCPFDNVSKYSIARSNCF